ncbi:RagB/SusD family nutrient uptake outer membrane protein [Chitinophaga horti]|uniref:RagB/SusD family nutrient uptake outer membrane protein n=1 Tax=Chitinophaga horti TaxID=2920382 RepID=A0ABY6J7Q2_9BACT|nr:RagB/SusD family nutrient uptake outer membrane protein [Chitinophaga horti]UYQ94612.1 RagB/SusD family nutrient uptake outer membrane protein [Chitinophaga horti]
MKKILHIIACCALVITGCKKDFITRPPKDELSDATYWTSERNVRIFSWRYYPIYFSGYGSGNTWGTYFSIQSLNDDFAPMTPTPFTKQAPNSGGGWSFNNVRQINTWMSRIKIVPMAEEATNHWIGVARFFRALEYADLVRQFGDVPFYNAPVTETDFAQLYKPRDPRVLVVDSILADLKYAAANVRVEDPSVTGDAGLVVNRAVVNAFFSRIMLHEGTWFKYHNLDQAKATEYLTAAKAAAEAVMTAGKYSLDADYRGIFSSMSLATSKEVLLYRKYETNQITHALMSYNNKEAQSGASKNAIESYLASDGLPIGVSPNYQGDKTIDQVFANRDGRLAATFVKQYRVIKVASNYSTTGYSSHKFLNESVKDVAEGNNALNQTDAPIIRLGEVLLNYAEATYELGQLTQADLDKSINLLRDRAKTARLKTVGGLPVAATAGGDVPYDDPKRDPTVAPMLWEIRRERRVEMMFEGNRLTDLKRWKKLAYTDTKQNVDINRGAWITKAQFPATDATLTNGTEGYIIPAPLSSTDRVFDNDRLYLNPLPVNQINLYKNNGYTLVQNLGWEQ